MNHIPATINIVRAKILPLILLSLLFITGCTQFANSALSSDYFDGLKSAAIYAKQDAIKDKCINYPVVLSINIMEHTKEHLDKFKGEKSPDFISGFSRGYGDEYREYMNLYCDSLDSSEEYERP